MLRQKLLAPDYSTVNIINLTILRSITYGCPAPAPRGIFKAGSKVARFPPLFLSGAFPAESYWLAGKQDDQSRRVECNRIQHDAGNAGPTSPVFLFRLNLGDCQDWRTAKIGEISGVPEEPNSFRPRISRAFPVQGTRSSHPQPRLILPAESRDCTPPCGSSTSRNP